MSLDNIVTLITLQQTFPLVIMGFIVFKQWYPSAWKAIKYKKSLNHYECLIIGVCFSMINKFTDPVYWAIPWSLNYLESPEAQFWFEIGSYSNLIFRQVCGVSAVFFHLLSTYKIQKINNSRLKIILIGSNLLGLVYIMLLYLIK